MLHKHPTQTARLAMIWYSLLVNEVSFMLQGAATLKPHPSQEGKRGRRRRAGKAQELKSHRETRHPYLRVATHLRRANALLARLGYCFLSCQDPFTAKAEKVAAAHDPPISPVVFSPPSGAKLVAWITPKGLSAVADLLDKADLGPATCRRWASTRLRRAGMLMQSYEIPSFWLDRGPDLLARVDVELRKQGQPRYSLPDAGRPYLVFALHHAKRLSWREIGRMLETDPGSVRREYRSLLRFVGGLENAIGKLKMDIEIRMLDYWIDLKLNELRRRRPYKQPAPSDIPYSTSRRNPRISFMR